MFKDILYALELGVKVVIAFTLMTYIGLRLNAYFNQRWIIMICLIIAFIYVMKLLLGAGRHG